MLFSLCFEFDLERENINQSYEQQHPFVANKHETKNKPTLLWQGPKSQRDLLPWCQSLCKDPQKKERSCCFIVVHLRALGRGDRSVKKKQARASLFSVCANCTSFRRDGNFALSLGPPSWSQTPNGSLSVYSGGGRKKRFKSKLMAKRNAKAFPTLWLCLGERKGWLSTNKRLTVLCWCVSLDFILETTTTAKQFKKKNLNWNKSILTHSGLAFTPYHGQFHLCFGVHSFTTHTWSCNIYWTCLAGTEQVPCVRASCVIVDWSFEILIYLYQIKILHSDWKYKNK